MPAITAFHLLPVPATERMRRLLELNLEMVAVESPSMGGEPRELGTVTSMSGNTQDALRFSGEHRVAQGVLWRP